MQCISVDLPEPDGPMMAVNWPAAKSTSTPSSARTSVSPLPYDFVAPRADAAAKTAAERVGAVWRSVMVVAFIESSGDEFDGKKCRPPESSGEVVIAHPPSG